jgi:hypothetical protein
VQLTVALRCHVVVASWFLPSLGAKRGRADVAVHAARSPLSPIDAMLPARFSTKLPAGFSGVEINRLGAAPVRSEKKDCSESMCYSAGSYYQDRDYKVLLPCSYWTNVKCLKPCFAGANGSAIRRGNSP